jgi:hypothetical protein
MWVAYVTFVYFPLAGIQLHNLVFLQEVLANVCPGKRLQQRF